VIRSEAAARARVLLVEDEAVIAMDLEQWLTELGFEVVGPFRRKRDGLRALRDGRIDFAVLDYLLGDDDSGAIADRLKRLRVPYVFLTGCPELLLHKTRHRAPMLEKPISWRQMTDALQNLEGLSLRTSAPPTSERDTQPMHR
jgi:DNA-binding response OmpR family regulator